MHVTIRSANLVMAALVVGAMFGIWLGYNPAPLSLGAYVEQQQEAIRSLNVMMPVLGGVAIVFTLINGAMTSDRWARMLLFCAALCLVVSGVVTRFRNQPINREVMTWSVQSPPADWRTKRDEWWRWHRVRTSTGAVGLALLAVGSLTAAGTERRAVGSPP